MIRSLLLRLLLGVRATRRGICARAVEHALHVDVIYLSRSERKLLTSRVMAALEGVGVRFE